MKEKVGGGSRTGFRWRAVALPVALIVVPLMLLGAEDVPYTWDPVPATEQLGGTGNWDNTSQFWKNGTGSPSFYPLEGANKDIQFLGDPSLLHLIGSQAFNDLYSGPANGTVNAIVNDLSILLSDGAVASRMEIADTTSLKISTRFFGSVPIGKFGAGTLMLDNAANNLTGGFLVNAGTLSLTERSAGSGLRSNPIHLFGGSTFAATAGTTVRIGTLTGSGTVSAGTLSLYVSNFGMADYAPETLGTYFRSGPVFSGAAMASGLNISGAGGRRVTLPGDSTFSIQTFSGRVDTIGGVMTINSGAALNLFSDAGVSGGAVNSTSINLRAGALILDSSKGSGGTAFGRVGNSATANLQGGTLALVGGALEIVESMGSLRASSGGSTVAVIQPGSPLAKLSFSGLVRDFNGRSTVDFRGVGGTLGSFGGPQIVVSGFSSTLDPWITVNGTDYATYSSSTGIAAGSYSSLSSAITGSGNSNAYYSTTQSSTLSGSTSYSARGIRFAPAANNHSLTIAGTGNLVPGGLLLVGDRDYSINATSTGGIGGSAPRYIGVMEPDTTLRISAPIRGAGIDVVKFGLGTLELTGVNNTLHLAATNFVINAGVLRGTISGPDASIPVASTGVVIRGGVLEIMNGAGGTGANADFRSGLGVGVGKVNWSTDTSYDEGSGGFSAIGSDATVNLGGAVPPTPVSWQHQTFVHPGHALVFGSRDSNARITFENPAELDNGLTDNPYVTREIRVHGNEDPEVQTDAARLSGSISGGLNADLLKTGDGTLELTAANPFTGNVLVQEGVLQLGAVGGAGEGSGAILGATSKIIVRANLDYIGSKLTVLDRATLRLGGSPLTSDRVNDVATLVLEAGRLESGGLSETFGTLIVREAESVIDLNGGDSVLRFASVADHAWSGTLLIYHWNGSGGGGGGDQVRFGSNGFGIRPDQLQRTLLYSDEGITFLGSAQQLSSGEIVPVPEPSPAIAILAGVVFLASRRRRVRW